MGQVHFHPLVQHISWSHPSNTIALNPSFSHIALSISFLASLHLPGLPRHLISYLKNNLFSLEMTPNCLSNKTIKVSSPDLLVSPHLIIPPETRSLYSSSMPAPPLGQILSSVMMNHHVNTLISCEAPLYFSINDSFKEQILGYLTVSELIPNLGHYTCSVTSL